MMRRGYSLVEVLVGLVVALLVIVLAWNLLGSSGRILKRSGRIAGGQIALQTLLETMSRDLEELEYFKEPAPLSVSGGGSGTYVLVIQSERYEPGLPPATKPVFRRVTYTIAPAEKDRSRLSRQVANLGPSGAIDDVAATGGTYPVAEHIKKLALAPFIWAPVPGQGVKLARAADPLNRQLDAAAACLSVNVSISEPELALSVDGGELALTTRLWCRGRLLQLPREGRP